jgi:hypothetical protein
MTLLARLRRAVPALLSVVVIAAAAVLWHHLPDMMDVEGPFDVDGSVGQPVRGRLIDLTVTGVRIGSKVRPVPRPSVAATGLWVVVDADLIATSTFVLPVAELHVGPNTYIPSDRFRPTQLGGELAPGIRQRGSWVFDVAPELIDRGAPMQIRIWHGDGRLDSRLVVSIPYTAGVRDAAPVTIGPAEAAA